MGTCRREGGREGVREGERERRRRREMEGAQEREKVLLNLYCNFITSQAVVTYGFAIRGKRWTPEYYQKPETALLLCEFSSSPFTLNKTDKPATVTECAIYDQVTQNNLTAHGHGVYVYEL